MVDATNTNDDDPYLWRITLERSKAVEQENLSATVAFDLLSSEVEHLQRMVNILAGRPNVPATSENDSLGKPGTTFSAEPAPFGQRTRRFPARITRR